MNENKLDIKSIIERINSKKTLWVKQFDDYAINHSKSEIQKMIESDFLSEDDITDRSSDFKDGVDYDEVCEIRAEALTDTLIALNVY